MSLVISAFPGTGKSHLFNHAPEGLRIADSDSSQWSWTSPGVRHPKWPMNYMEHIQSLINDGVDLILVSSHKEVRDALVDFEIPFTLVFPQACLKNEYLQRFAERGSPEKFIELLDQKWSEWVSPVNTGAAQVVLLGSGEFLSDAVKAQGAL